ncbi:MAG: TOBE domain-containing protein [Ruminococcus flavefaciens]|nr:TOBE domain-containing protein [Ruminococcus flavefaciens]
MRKLKAEYDDGEEHDCILGVRGEHVKISNNGVSATVSDMEILGSETHLHLASDSTEKDVIIKLTERAFSANQQVKIAFDESKVHLFDAVTEETVLEKA